MGSERDVAIARGGELCRDELTAVVAVVMIVDLEGWLSWEVKSSVAIRLIDNDYHVTPKFQHKHP
jgi:hypothetical protein